MKRLLFIIALLLASSVLFAQDMVVRQTPIVRAFPLNQSGGVLPAGGTAPDFLWKFTQTIGATVVTDSGHTMTRAGDPEKVDDGTWPSGLSGSQGNAYYMDDVDDSFSLSTTTDVTPSGDFSLQCAVTPDTVSGSHGIMSIYVNAGQRSWLLYQSNATVVFTVSDDGTNAESNTTGNLLAAGRMSFITVSVDVSENDSFIYVDNNATVSKLNHARLPVYQSSTDDFLVGKFGAAAEWDGLMHYCAFYDGKVISEAEHDLSFAKFQGRVSSAADHVVTVTSATPPSVMLTALDSGTQPMFVDVGANSGMVGSPASGSGGIYGAGAITNLAQRASFETWAGGAATGWTEASGGAGDATQDTTNMVHGLSSATLDCSGAGDTISITSNCLDVDPTKDYVLSLYAKELTGNSDLNITVKGWSDASCESDEETELTNTPGDITTSWVRYPTGTNGQILAAAWEGTTEYATIIIDNSDDNGTGTLSVDGLMFMEGTKEVADALAVCDTDASCTTSAVQYTIANPVSGAGTWRIEHNQRFPFDPENSTTRYMFEAAKTGGANDNIIALFISSPNRITTLVYDSASAVKYARIDAASWSMSADTDYSLKWVKGHDGELDVCLGSQCQTSSDDPGITNDTNATLYINSYTSTTSVSNGWMKDLKFYRRLSP
jgi:hypothetical protein